MAMTRRRLWLNAQTADAIMVAPEPLHHADSNRWLPRSQITLVSTDVIENPLFGKLAQIAKIMGTLATIDAPDWLWAEKGLLADAQIEAEA
jgi:hypothetical protein